MALLLTAYCLVIIAVSLAGGWLPMVLRLTHRRLQVGLSFVSGVMLGVALLHLLPHAILARLGPHGDHAHGPDQAHDHVVEAAAGAAQLGLDGVMGWMIAGFLVMFLAERFFCFHHHEAPSEEVGGPADVGTCAHHDHVHRLTWSGAVVGLTLHTLIAGIALAASVRSEWSEGLRWAGFGTFLVIVLHKPFDALTITTLMTAGRHGTRARHTVNFLFSLAIPAGVGLFFAGLAGAAAPESFVSGALAFSAGTFLCIALSDVLPELQFHAHDRVKLSAALIIGLALAAGMAYLESQAGHAH